MTEVDPEIHVAKGKHGKRIRFDGDYVEITKLAPSSAAPKRTRVHCAEIGYVQVHRSLAPMSPGALQLHLATSPSISDEHIPRSRDATTIKFPWRHREQFQQIGAAINSAVMRHKRSG